MLVYPADVDSAARTPPEARRFAPMPLDPLPFRTLVIVSSDDPYVDANRARYFARCWEARLVDVGAQGHINTEPGYGQWPDGKRYVGELLRGM